MNNNQNSRGIQNKGITPLSINRNLKQESVEFTLPAIPIDRSHRIEYYYPYFYRTHVVDYYDSLNMNELTYDCIDLGCEWCDKITKNVCQQCRHGYFLYNTKCYTTCPERFVADIFKRRCNPHDINSKIKLFKII